MADNRLWIICTECKAANAPHSRFFLAKAFAYQWTSPAAREYEGDFDDWLEEHSHHNGHVFALEYEMP